MRLRLFQAILLLAAASTCTSRPLAAQTQHPQPAFDVVSIKPNHTDTGSGFGFDAAGYQALDASLSQTLYTAYFAKTNGVQILNMPAWVTQEQYDIVAKIDPASAPAWAAMSSRQRENAGRAMLQAMLAERCKLTAHLVPSKAPGYALVISKTSPSLRPAQPHETYPPGARDFGDGGAKVVVATPATNNRMLIFGASVSDLVDLLEIFGIQVLIEDRTGLTGRYDLELPKMPPAPSETAAPDATRLRIPSDYWDLRAVGLELKPIPDVSTQNLVIDHIERPTPN